jgi:predicted dehydrogenase/threonine dehydrogenase-like Zn-dependent dehydrogenase
MLQVVQDLKSGKTKIVQVPKPISMPLHAIIRTKKSLISSGTEKSLVDFGKSGLIGKALGQPEKVKMVLDKVKADGVAAAYSAVRSKLDEPMQLGYCNVGTVFESSLDALPPGVRVVSNGKHASLVRVPYNLIAKIPDEVSDEDAAFTVLGAIALQGVRLASPSIGENVVVIGLGLIGLLTVQILKANGCRVLGIDFDSGKCALAEQFGAEVVDLSKEEDPLAAAATFSKGRGVDAVLITASSKGSDIMHQAAVMSRKRGRIVLVGVVGLELNRADFYEKELSFQVSCSYGPGRYDEEYEDKGNDYPYAYVRWTEQRNLEAVLELMATGSISVKPLISHRFAIDEAANAYEMLDDPGSLGIVLDYNSVDGVEDTLSKVPLTQGVESTPGAVKVAFIGGGNYASRVLIPAFKKAGANLAALVTSGGMSAVHHGEKNGFSIASTDINDALADQVDAVVIATRHNLHSSQAIRALERKKHVFVEKPLALTLAEIDDIELAQKASGRMIMVGYNRRFSPQIVKVKSLLDKKVGPKTFIMTMNAGEIPKENWAQDAAIGGGRIIGEACHYIDLMRHLAGSKITAYNAIKIGRSDNIEVTEDKAIITLSFEDGSIGSIHYFANGGRVFPKERVEIFCDGAVLQLDNFRRLKGFGWSGFKTHSAWSQNKGQNECAKAFMDAIGSGVDCPIPMAEMFEVSRISVAVADLLRE